MSKIDICKKCSKQDDCFEVRGEMFCSEKCCYDWTKKENERREQEDEEERRENSRREQENKRNQEDRAKARLERWEEIEDEIFFLNKKRNRFGLNEKDLEEVKALQKEINSLIEEEGKKWILRKFKKNDLRDLKWWEQDPDPNDKKNKKDLFDQLKDEIELLKERIDELENKPNKTDKEKSWLKRNKDKLFKLEQELSRGSQNIEETNAKPINYLPWIIGGVFVIFLVILVVLLTRKRKTISH